MSKQLPINGIYTATLPQLAKIANKAADEARAHAVSSVDEAVKSGAALNQAKELCGHGDWVPWLNENFTYSVRTAQKFMQIASAGPDLLCVRDSQ